MTTSEPMAISESELVAAANSPSLSVPEGSIQFESGVNRNLVLDEEGGRITQRTRDESRQAQIWRLLPISGSADRFHITRSSDPNWVLAALDEWTLAVQPLTDNIANQWILRMVSSEIYVIENLWQSTKVISAEEPSNQPTNIILFENQNLANQRWQLVSLLPPLPRGPEWENIPKMGGLVGGVPLCEWDLIRPQKIGERKNIPIIVELYENSFLRTPAWQANRRCRIEQSNPNLANVLWNGSSTASTTTRVSNNVSAVVVRPGPDYNSTYLYKVTLFDHTNYDRGTASANNLGMLPLTIGVYPDLTRLYFNKRATSILFEQGRPGNFSYDFEAPESYYVNPTRA